MDKIIPLDFDMTGRVKNPIPIIELIRRKKTVIILSKNYLIFLKFKRG